MADIRLDKGEIIDFLEYLDKSISKKLTVFLIGGGAMSLKNLKESTIDIDIVVNSRKDFNVLKHGLLKIGFKIDKEIHEIRAYHNAVMVFLKDSSRIDIFIKTICGMLDFTQAMEERADLFKHFEKLTVKLASNEDILLLKSLSDREKDLPDCRALIETGLKWNIILKECIKQHRKDTKWVFWLYEQLCRVENKYDITIPAKLRVLKVCEKNWKFKPQDFMHDIDNIDKHISDKRLLKDIVK